MSVFGLHSMLGVKSANNRIHLICQEPGGGAKEIIMTHLDYAFVMGAFDCLIQMIKAYKHTGTYLGIQQWMEAHGINDDTSSDLTQMVMRLYKMSLEYEPYSNGMLFLATVLVTRRFFDNLSLMAHENKAIDWSRQLIKHIFFDEREPQTKAFMYGVREVFLREKKMWRMNVYDEYSNNIEFIEVYKDGECTEDYYNDSDQINQELMNENFKQLCDSNVNSSVNEGIEECNESLTDIDSYIDYEMSASSGTKTNFENEDISSMQGAVGYTEDHVDTSILQNINSGERALPCDQTQYEVKSYPVNNDNASYVAVPHSYDTTYIPTQYYSTPINYLPFGLLPVGSQIQNVHPNHTIQNIHHINASVQPVIPSMYRVVHREMSQYVTI